MTLSARATMRWRRSRCDRGISCVGAAEASCCSAIRAATREPPTCSLAHALSRAGLVSRNCRPEDVTLYQLFQGRHRRGAGAHTRGAGDLRAGGRRKCARHGPRRCIARCWCCARPTRSISPRRRRRCSAEAMLWRGNPLEVNMQKLLAELYFDHKRLSAGVRDPRDGGRAYIRERADQAARRGGGGAVLRTTLSQWRGRPAGRSRRAEPLLRFPPA